MALARLKLVSPHGTLSTEELTAGLPSDLLPEKSQRNWKGWILVGLITLLFHVLVFWIKPIGWQTNPTLQPPRVDIHQVDPKKLEAIRKQWRNREKALLLDKDKSPIVPTPDNPDARYMSDRNKRVEKEQRARETNVIPRSGAKTQSDRTAEMKAAKPATPAQKARARNQTGTKLGTLGVNLGLDQPPRPEQNATPAQSQEQASGGDQALLDKSLAAGAENMLNTQESVYYSFYARIYEAIGPIWQSRIREGLRSRTIPPNTYLTEVDVVFDSEGNLLEVHHIKDCGIQEFDQAVDKAWKAVGKFPNPPKALLNSRGEVHVGWTFGVELGAGTGVQLLAPERNY
ncbi:MAG: TonB C-terminal domain-containing protein [Methylotenera sp.]|nr:TonB C-terminal domain-containing protein [Oligoflexia bacterium]